MHRDGDYALIHVLDPARAAQYSALVEQHHLSGARSRSEEEARFHAQRLGPAALIIAEVRQSPDGFDLLRRLRKGKRPQLAPAVLISGSLQVRNEAIKLKEQLDIVEVLTGTQPLSTVRAAVARAIHRGPRTSRHGHLYEVPQPSQPPLIGASKEELLQAAARDLGASTALAWFGSPEDGELMGWFGWDTSLVPMIGEREDWAPFRNLAAEAPVYVTDARHDSLLQRSAMVKTGLVRSFAGAPLCNDEGEAVGALWVADDRPAQLGTQALHPLSVWAHRLGAAWEDAARKKAITRLHAVAGEEKFKPSVTPAMEAMSQVLSHSSDGFIATDGEDRIAYANPAATRLLGLKGRRLMGLTRTHLLELACQKAGLAPLVAETLRSTLNATQLVTLQRPQRIMRWETKLLPLGTEMGKMDQLVDCTAEVEERETRAKLARIDPLTWLANRRGFEDALAREISRAFRFKTPLTLALFRIDGRSDLEEPDKTQILREVSWLIAEISRGYDQSARLEDDSLALILPGATPEAAKSLYKRIAEEVAGLKTRRAKAVTLSTGIALFDPGEDVGQMLARARAAMLEAEASGGDTVL